MLRLKLLAISTASSFKKRINAMWIIRCFENTFNKYSEKDFENNFTNEAHDNILFTMYIYTILK